jgi:hypothetical protein
LEPFRLEDLDVSTAIIFERLTLPTTELRDLARVRVTFPVNPEAGYVDGSVYIEHAHHPADLTEIEFGEHDGATIAARLSLNLLFSFEGLMDFADTACNLAVRIRSESG